MSKETDNKNTRISHETQRYIVEEERKFEKLADSLVAKFLNSRTRSNQETPSASETNKTVAETMIANGIPSWEYRNLGTSFSLIPTEVTVQISTSPPIGKRFKAKGLGKIHSFTQPEINDLRDSHRKRRRILRETHQQIIAEKGKQQDQQDPILLSELSDRYHKLSNTQGAYRAGLSRTVRH